MGKHLGWAAEYYPRRMTGLPYERYSVWHKAFALALEVLELGERDPLRTRYWMRDQICGAAMSIPANVAEGAGRGTNKDFASFIDRARGSAFELDVWLKALHARSEISDDQYASLTNRTQEVSAMLNGLRKTLRSAPANPRLT